MSDVEKMEAMDKMDAKEFSEALWDNAVHSEGEWPGIIARRDAYREREALKAAAERASKWLSQYPHETSDLRAAILGEPRFAVGQLVRNRRTGYTGVVKQVKDGDVETNDSWILGGNAEPVKAHIDAEGRVIVEEA